MANAFSSKRSRIQSGRKLEARNAFVIVLKDFEPDQKRERKKISPKGKKF